jgi:cytochrome P450
MSVAAVDEGLCNPTGCPVTNCSEINVATAPAGWHQSNFDAKREEAPIHTGDASGHQFFLVPRMADIRKSFQSADTFSNSAVVPSEPDPPYRWIPEMLDGPIHMSWRRLLTPLWALGAVEKIKLKLRQRFGEVLDSIVASSPTPTASSATAR